jgi:8-oxo-dGTP pyrophosphatase MutT (NUDIX family)
MEGSPRSVDGPPRALTMIAAGAVRRGSQDAWLVQERRVVAATGGTMSFFGGVKEPQDHSMRETMQRESAEELVLINKHGRPSRQPIRYGAEIATVIVSTFEIHLFVAQIDEGANVCPSETELAKTGAIHWLPLSALLITTDARMMPSTRLLAACIANVPRDVMNDLLRPTSSLFAMINPRDWSRQPRMRPSRITAASDRRTVSTYLHRYTTMTPSDGPAIATYAAAEDALVAWLHQCAAGHMKLCDLWELLSFSAHQIKTQHVNVPQLALVDDAPVDREPDSDSHRQNNVARVANEDVERQRQDGTQAAVDRATADPDAIWYVVDFIAAPRGMWVKLRENGWMQDNPGREMCVLSTPQRQARVSQRLEQICVGDSVKLVKFQVDAAPPMFAIVAAALE